jgi:apolipoprotein N-acyltransferase
MFGAGALSTIAMAPLHFWPVLLFTLPALFWALDDRSSGQASGSWRSAVWRGWAFGFGYHFAGLYWIGFSFLVQAEKFAILMPFAIAALTASLALFFAAAGLGFALARARVPPGLPRIVLLALVLLSSEWLRGHILTGFPWNTLGYALTMPLPLMQSAGLFGIYVLTGIAVLTLTAPVVLLASSCAAPWRIIMATTIAPLLLATIYGTWQLSANPTTFDPDVRLRLVQPSFTQKDKFVGALRGPIFLRHLELSRQGFQAGRPRPGTGNALPTHIIWPEAAIPFFARRDRNALAAINATLPDDVRIIAGTFRINVAPDVPNDKVGAFRVFNSAVAIGGDGKVKSVYDKIHLVPFGEYLPAQRFLNALGFENLTRSKGGLALGRAPRQLMRIAGLPPAAMLICYEASFPDEIVQGAERPGLLINLTNDAWFGSTSGPYQHLHQTRLRSVEQGLSMIRSANNGISAVIDPMGRIIARMGLNKVGVLDSRLPKPAAVPIYARFGRLIELMALLIMSVYLTICARQFRHSGQR